MASQQKGSKSISFTVYEDSQSGKTVTHLTRKEAIKFEAVVQNEAEFALLMESKQPMQAARLLAAIKKDEGRAQYARELEQHIYLENMQKLMKQERQ